MARHASTPKRALNSTSSLKRRLSSTVSTPTNTKRNRSATAGTTVAKSTPKKSPHFEGVNDASESDSLSENEEDKSVSLVSTPPESEEDEEYGDGYTSEDSKPKKTKKRRNDGNVAKSRVNQEIWRPGVKTGLGPGRQVFIKLPKAREAGKTPYKDDTIHPNTMSFLKDLKQNNDREWLKMHDADYRQSKKDFDTFVESLTGKIIEKDETIPELPPKDIVQHPGPTFRIYRDIRFSPDPTPYKSYFSAAWSRTGRKGPYAAYYVQIQPGGSFVGGGIWHPEAPPLALLRHDINQRSHILKRILLEPSLRKEFFGGTGKDETKVVKAFISQNMENMLKTKPKGYDAENPNIGLLRLRNYTIGRKLKDDEVVGPKGLNRILELIGALTPFISYLNSVVMPDPGSNDDIVAENTADEGNGDDNSDD